MPSVLPLNTASKTYFYGFAYLNRVMNNDSMSDDQSYSFSDQLSDLLGIC